MTKDGNDMRAGQIGSTPDRRAADPKPLVCFILSSPYFLNAFLLGHIHRISLDFRVLVFLNLQNDDVRVAPSADFETRHIAIRRDIAPWHDLCALFELIRIFRSLPLSAVVSFTPKAGLLGMLAARCAGIPVRIHYFTGQVWATAKGGKRLLLKSLDQVLAACSTALLTDSSSQKEYLVSQGISRDAKIQVLGSGSICGVDLKRFRWDAEAREDIRAALGIPEDAKCLLYIGRMNRDKGVEDLLQAFHSLRSHNPSVHLLLVGPDEGRLLKDVTDANIHPIGYTLTVEKYMSACDILCLPSYREGFGNVLIEAAAVGLPAVASRIYGITDAVVEGVTALLHRPGDIEEIETCLSGLLDDPLKCRELGDHGRKRAAEWFSSEIIENLFSRFLLDCLKKYHP
ncbi:MAG: glycosyltransferase [Terrimicrobiaceae bacterium]